MPNIGNIVVKNEANADVTFTAITGAAGDAPAIWRMNVLGASPLYCPQLHMWQKANRDGSVRRIEWKLFHVLLDVNAKPEYKLASQGVHFIPQGANFGVGDFATYIGGLLSDPSIRGSFKSGFLPT